MKTIACLFAFGLVVSCGGGVEAADVSIREYPDKIVVELDGSRDPKPEPPRNKEAPQKSPAEQETVTRMEEEAMMRYRSRVEDRMEKQRMRMEFNEKALEKRKKEQEEAERQWR